MDKIKRIQVFGERCSGTNYLENLLKQNIQDVALCRDFGHKHFFHKSGVRKAHDCLFVVIYRNPFDWLRSLHRQPYHAAMELRNISFSEFIRKPWRCIWDEEADKKPDDPVYGKEMMFERNPQTGKPFQNVIRMRTGKIRNWASLQNKTRHHVYVRYESLKEAPDAFMDLITERFGLRAGEAFHNVEGYRGFKEKYEPRTYASISQGDLQYILKHLNTDIEASIGYPLDELARMQVD